ncbi:hypothetical protein Tsubulata_026803 [Turnera subulata]|uniref:RRM domain-containing protein n=1 Tax=Turnera subulata TaxID=218843 RepID=A0A9Q0JQ06_9ROSI|nr:hypothetical protein Tsubulata_026803 [Turnera subulata]
MALPTSPMSPTLPTPPQPSNADNLNLNTDNLKPHSDKQVMRAMANGQVYSLYVQNLASHWSLLDVYRIMSKCREVVDVYLPRKVAKNRQKFGFVRFRSNCDLQRLLLDVNKVQVADGAVQANVAREQGTAIPPRSRGGQQPYSEVLVGKRSFVDTVKGGKDTDNTNLSGISYIPTTDTKEWLSRSAVGVLKDPAKMELVKLVWNLHDMSDVAVSIKGGIQFLSAFRIRTGCFVSVGSYRTGCPSGSKLSNHDFFTLVGSVFREVVQVVPETVYRSYLVEARVQLLTEIGGFLNRELSIQIAGSNHSIFVVEDTGKRIIDVDGSDSFVLEEREVHQEGDSGESSSSPASGERGVNGKSSAVDFQVTNSDPFQIMGILQPESRDKGVNVAIAESGGGKPVDQGDEGRLPHSESGGINGMDGIVGFCNQCHQSLWGVRKPAISHPTPVFNTYGPLDGCDELDSSTPKTKSDSLGPCTRSNIQSFSTGSSKSRSVGSSHSKSNSYLVKRLEWAVKTARVIQRKKYKKLTKSGNVTSTETSTNDDIRRVNLRLSQPNPSHSSSASFSEQEARETVRVGVALGWDSSTAPEENPKGILSESKRKHLHSLIIANSAAFVFLCETKAYEITESWCRSFWVSQQLEFLAVDSAGASGGLIFLWDSEWPTLAGSHSAQEAWTLLGLSLLWSVWLARNALVFTQREAQPDMLFDVIRVRTHWWLKLLHPQFPYHVAMVLGSSDVLKDGSLWKPVTIRYTT